MKTIVAGQNVISDAEFIEAAVAEGFEPNPADLADFVDFVAEGYGPYAGEVDNENLTYLRRTVRRRDGLAAVIPLPRRRLSGTQGVRVA